MKKDYVFAQTYTKGRGGLYADFKMMSREDFISKVKSGDENFKRYNRVSKSGHENTMLKRLTVEEFEDIFFENGELFLKDKKYITNSFRKDVALKYGLESIINNK